MDKFTASNGHDVERYSGSLDVGGGEIWIQPWAVDALREFFQAERDEELGRWRWPENPEWVVYFNPDNTIRAVFNERTADYGDGLARWEIDLLLPSENGDVLASAAFFEAHPERKPWEDAKPGEVWDVDVELGGIRAVTVYSARHDEPITVFRDPYTQVEYETNDPTIRDARRIYPGGAS